jgi:hypothetical protein
MNIPKLHTDCIPYIESCGYKYSHRNITHVYVFYRHGDNFEVSFNLTEIREAFKHGW